MVGFLQSVGHLMHDPTADHGHAGGKVADSRFRHGKRISTQNREVSELSRLERSRATDSQIGQNKEIGTLSAILIGDESHLDAGVDEMTMINP